MKEKLLRSLIREELKQLIEFAPGKFATNTFTDIEVKNKTMSDIEVSQALDNALKGRHASGRSFSAQFRSGLHENVEDFIVDYGKLLHKMNDDFNDKDIFYEIPHGFNTIFQIAYQKVDALHATGKISPDEMKVFQSIILFTGGNVATVRDPSLFNSKKSKNTNKDLFKNLYSVTNETYKTANSIMTSLAMSKNYSKFNEISRGVKIKSVVADNLRPGIEFNNWPISSFTKMKAVSLGFSLAEDISEKQVLIVIKNPSHGSDISKFSQYPNEQEVVLGKKLVIKNVQPIRYGTYDDDFLEVQCDIVP